ncbi:low temperature requirement protein A, partial [Listeria monocytogenes]|uniref:low temperature requirement protein A n=1 Tax=Listeria monocytogenes TaxID=1639 RepID=UPI00210019D8
MTERKVSWLELFFDLIFVTAVASTTHLLLSVDNHPDKTAAYFIELMEAVKDARAKGNVYPSEEDMFSCFRLCPYNQVKVVILG